MKNSDMARAGEAARRLTEGRPPTTAVGKTWAITEISERILVHLPIKDLLLAQRVCSAWRELIQTSPALQELLFMRPKPQKDPSVPVIRELNPLLVRNMPMWFRNPDRRSQSIMNAPWANTDARLAFLRRDASWRNMLVAQPPPTVYEQAEGMTVYGGSSICVGYVEQPDGVRMGPVYDSAVSARCNNFYALLDGKIPCDPKDLVFLGPQPSERIFGGANKFTLVISRHRGCTRGGFDSYREELLKQVQMTSAGSKLGEMELKRVERPARSPKYNWWADDGHLTM